MKKSVVAFLLLAALVAMLAGAGIGQAAHCSQGGSPHDAHGSCEEANNNLHCGAGTATAVGQVYAGTTGVGVCNDGAGAVPVQGRVGANGGGSGTCSCVYADGDKDNTAIPMSNGWIRIDGNGSFVHCDAPGSQSYNQPGGTGMTGGCP